MLAGYLFTIVVTRAYGPHAWGGFTLATTVVLAGTTVARLGLDTALLRVVAANHDAGASTLIRVHATASRVVLPTSAAIAALVYFLADVVAVRVFGAPELRRSFQLAALAIPPLALSSLTAQSLRGLRQIQLSVFLDYVSRWLYPLIVLLLLLAFWRGEQMAIIAYVCGAYITAIIGAVRLDRQFRRVGDSAADQEPAVPSPRGLILLGLPLLLASSTDLVRGYIDTLMLGVYLSPAEVGVYGVAIKLSSLVGLSLLAVNSIAAPDFARHHKMQDRTALIRTVRRSTALIVASSLPALVLLVLFAAPTMRLFGEGFDSGTLALRILVAGQCINAMSGSVGYLLQMSGRQVAYQNITLGSTVIKIALNLLLIPVFGIVGAAFATAVTVVTWNLVGVWYAHRVLGISTFFNPLRILRSRNA